MTLDDLIDELLRVRGQLVLHGKRVPVVMCTAGGSGECGKVTVAHVDGKLEVQLLEVL